MRGIKIRLALHTFWPNGTSCACIIFDKLPAWRLLLARVLRGLSKPSVYIYGLLIAWLCTSLCLSVFFAVGGTGSIALRVDCSSFLKERSQVKLEWFNCLLPLQ